MKNQNHPSCCALGIIKKGRNNYMFLQIPGKLTIYEAQKNCADINIPQPQKVSLRHRSLVGTR